jgi:hypothetical protein
MSAPASHASAAKVKEARDLHLPQPDERVEEVFQWLTPEGAQRFSWEMLSAVVQAKRTNDLRSLEHVIESWYRSLLFMRDPEFPIRAARAIADPGTPEDAFPVEETQKALGL